MSRTELRSACAACRSSFEQLDDRNSGVHPLETSAAGRVNCQGVSFNSLDSMRVCLIMVSGGRMLFPAYSPTRRSMAAVLSLSQRFWRSSRAMRRPKSPNWVCSGATSFSCPGASLATARSGAGVSVSSVRASLVAEAGDAGCSWVSASAECCFIFHYSIGCTAHRTAGLIGPSHDRGVNVTGCC